MAKILDSIPGDTTAYYADMLYTRFIGAEKGKISIDGTVAVLAQNPVGLMATAGQAANESRYRSRIGPRTAGACANL